MANITKSAKQDWANYYAKKTRVEFKASKGCSPYTYVYLVSKKEYKRDYYCHVELFNPHVDFDRSVTAIVGRKKNGIRKLLAVSIGREV